MMAPEAVIGAVTRIARVLSPEMSTPEEVIQARALVAELAQSHAELHAENCRLRTALAGVGIQSFTTLFGSGESEVASLVEEARTR